MISLDINSGNTNLYRLPLSAFIYIDRFGFPKPLGIPLFEDFDLAAPLTCLSSNYIGIEKELLDGCCALLLLNHNDDTAEELLLDRVERLIFNGCKAIIVSANNRELPTIMRRKDTSVPVLFINKRLITEIIYRETAIDLTKPRTSNNITGLNVRIAVLEEGFSQYTFSYFNYVYTPELADRIYGIAAFLDNALQYLVEALRLKSPPLHMTVILYKDISTKVFYSGHIGQSFNWNLTIGAVNDETLLNALAHELTHMLAARIGHPPLILCEGLAMYMANQISPKCGIVLDKERLVAYAMKQQEQLPYHEAGSFVTFLVDWYGWSTLLSLYRQTNSQHSFEMFSQAVENLYGKSLSKLLDEWLGV